MTHAALQVANIGYLQICLSRQSVSAGGRAHLPRLRMSHIHGSAAGPAPQHTNAQHNAHAQLFTEHAYYRRADTCGEGGFGDLLGQTKPKDRPISSFFSRTAQRGRSTFARTCRCFENVWAFCLATMACVVIWTQGRGPV